MSQNESALSHILYWLLVFLTESLTLASEASRVQQGKIRNANGTMKKNSAKLNLDGKWFRCEWWDRENRSKQVAKLASHIGHLMAKQASVTNSVIADLQERSHGCTEYHELQHSTIMPQAPVEPRFYDSLDRLNFVYPHYESPFQVSINANFSRWMDRYCCEWAVQTSGPMRKHQAYVDSIYRSDLGFFSAVCFPSANWHRLEKLMKWCLMFFIADDYHDIVTQMTSANSGDRLQVNYFWQHMIDMLDGLERKESFCKPEWPDFIRGIQTVLSEIYFDYNEEQVRRSVRMIKEYIEGNVLETQWYTPDCVDQNNNNQGGKEHYGNGSGHSKHTEDDAERIPSWEEYMQARLGSVGGQMSMQLIEFATGVALPEHQFSHPTMRALVEAISREMTLVNDYLTFRKEVAENNYKFSLMRHAFTVLVNQGMTLQEAVNHVHELLKQADNEIFRLMDEMMVLSGHSNQMRRYLEGVSQFVGGYWRHAVTARRYHGLNFTGSIPPEGHFLYDPNQTVIVSKAYNNHRYPWQSEVPDNVQPS